MVLWHVGGTWILADIFHFILKREKKQMTNLHPRVVQKVTVGVKVYHQPRMYGRERNLRSKCRHSFNYSYSSFLLLQHGHIGIQQPYPHTYYNVVLDKVSEFIWK